MWLLLLFIALNILMAILGRHVFNFSAFEISPAAIAILVWHEYGVVVSALFLSVSYAVAGVKDVQYLWITLPVTLLTGRHDGDGCGEPTTKPTHRVALVGWEHERVLVVDAALVAHAPFPPSSSATYSRVRRVNRTRRRSRPPSKRRRSGGAAPKFGWTCRNRRPPISSATSARHRT